MFLCVYIFNAKVNIPGFVLPWVLEGQKSKSLFTANASLSIYLFIFLERCMHCCKGAADSSRRRPCLLCVCGISYSPLHQSEANVNMVAAFYTISEPE